MKRQLFTFVFLSFIIPLSSSQTIIDATITPEIGDKSMARVLAGTSIDPGPAGQNQVWDFSGINETGSLDLIFEILDPIDALGGSDYPTATFVWYLSGFEIYEFYEASENGLSLVGGTSGTVGEIDFQTIFTNTEDGLQFPISYNTNYEYDSEFDQYIFGNLLSSGSREGEVTADGEGTLITPLGTFENVLRLKIVETSFGVTSTQYAWMSNESFIPYMVYEFSDDPEEEPSVYYSNPENIINSMTNHAFSKNLKMNLFYSSENLLKLQIENDILLKNIEFSILDLNGRTIYEYTQTEFSTGQHLLEFTTPELGGGIYAIQLKSEQGATAQTFHVFR